VRVHGKCDKWVIHDCIVYFIVSVVGAKILRVFLFMAVNSGQWRKVVLVGLRCSEI